ncbi:hypothetical protein K1719_020922 [Acacia pycnantha]|nr:hypothetical protein K1719_020922 [Acacia pycnantha]
MISIFNYPGRVVGKHCSSTLEGIDKKVAEWYILNNCEEAGPYLKHFSNYVRSTNPLMSDFDIDQFMKVTNRTMRRKRFTPIVNRNSTTMRRGGRCAARLKNKNRPNDSNGAFRRAFR